MSFLFQYADKRKFEQISNSLFEMLHTNMSEMIPTGNSYEDDLRIWRMNIVPALNTKSRQIILMYVDGRLTGYFQYCINDVSLIMEEIQIIKECQGIGLFSAFFAWLTKQLPRDIQTVEAFSNKKNIKSQGILEYLGLLRTGESKNGNSFYYRGEYSAIVNKYGYI